MPLSIRNSKVEKLARQKAAERNTTVTAVIGEALAALPPPRKESFAQIARRLSGELALHAQGKGQRLSKDEIDEEWMG